MTKNPAKAAKARNPGFFRIGGELGALGHEVRLMPVQYVKASSATSWPS
jgi:hypothetical protein